MQLLLSHSDYTGAGILLTSHGALATTAEWEEIEASGAVDILLDLAANGTDPTVREFARLQDERKLKYLIGIEL